MQFCIFSETFDILNTNPDIVTNELSTDNKMMKVLFVSIAGPPKGSPESLQVSKCLKYLIGHQLNIYLVTEKLPKVNFGWRTLETKYQAILSQVTQVIKVPVYYHRYLHAVIRRLSHKILPRLDNEFLFTLATRRILKDLMKKPDIIYSRSTPFSSAALAMKLKRKYGVPWIMHLSDPWVLSPFFYHKGSVLKYHQKMERDCFKNADKITFTSQEQIGVYKQVYPEYQSKFMWFPNVFDESEIFTNPPLFSPNMSFLHTGNFYGPGRSPDSLLWALERISNHYPKLLKNISFLFTGYHEPSVDKLLKRFESIGVKHLGVLPLEEIYKLQRQSSVLIIIDWQLPKDQAMFLLSKTLDYLAARKPIIAITTSGSTLYKLIQGVYGQCFDHHDIEGIKKHIVSLIDGYRNNHSTFLNPYEVNMEYSAGYQAKRLFELMTETAKMNVKVPPDE